MTTAISFQPYSNFTIYQTASGKFCIKQNNGSNSVNGQPTLEAAIRSADTHFGNLMIHIGTMLEAA